MERVNGMCLNFCLNLFVVMLLIFSFFSHGEFATIIELPEGEHQYKFFVDGTWIHDPNLVHISM